MKILPLFWPAFYRHVVLILKCFFKFLFQTCLDFLSGPANWAGICSTGKRQSPIDIKSTEATPDKGLGEFTLKNYDRKLNKTFTGSNTGYAFGISFPERVYNVSGGGLNGVYTTVQFHFHYGPNDTVGSEHIVDGEHYAAEVSEWVSDWVTGWVDEWMNGWWVGEWVVEWEGGLVCEWVSGWVGGWGNEWVVGWWVSGGVRGWVGLWVSDWVGG